MVGSESEDMGLRISIRGQGIGRSEATWAQVLYKLQGLRLLGWSN